MTEQEIITFINENKEVIRFDIEESVKNFLKNENDFKGVFSFAYQTAYLEFVSNCIIEILMNHNLHIEDIYVIIDAYSIEELENGFFTDKEYYKREG